ncbi:MAG: carboxymuconolactone decarboxylase family protein [Lautropia sp.]
MPRDRSPDYPLTRAYRASGDWNPLWDQVESLDPDFIEAYLAFRSVPHRKGPLPPWMKELILIAVNVATTHLYAPGARRHMQNALRQGATPAEILETIQLTSVLGIHAINLAVPMLCEEVARFDAAGGKRAGKARTEPRPRAGAGAAVTAGAGAAVTAGSGAAGRKPAAKRGSRSAQRGG